MQRDTLALTDCLFDEDAHLREFEAEMVAVAPDAVALSRTCGFDETQPPSFHSGMRS